MLKKETAVYRGYRFRIYPNKEQKIQIGKVFSTVHYVYNSLRQCWIEDSRLDFQCELMRLVERERWLKIIHRSILNNAARQLEQACRKCEENDAGDNRKLYRKTGGMQEKKTVRAQEGRSAPRKKCRNDAYSSFTISSREIAIRNARLILGEQTEIRPVKIAGSRAIPSNASILSATVSRKSSDHYYVSLLCRMPAWNQKDQKSEGHCWNKSSPGRICCGSWKLYGREYAEETSAPLQGGIRAVGLDFSLSCFFVASDSSLVPDEQYLHRYRNARQKLAAANRRLSGMRYMSQNFQKQRELIARIHEKIANQRGDYLQKLSTRIADSYDVVCVETLDLIEMGQKNHGYARKVADSGWSDFVRMLDYKLKDRGKDLVRVSKWYASSRICHECGYMNHDLEVTDRKWICPVCGIMHDRDQNASRNIRDEGLRILRNRSGRGTEKYDECGFSQGNMLADRQTSYPVGNASNAVRPEADNQMSRFWGQGPYGWEYRGCAWDAQFYVSRMDRDDIEFDGNGPEIRKAENTERKWNHLPGRSVDEAIAEAPEKTFYVEDGEERGDEKCSI